MRLTQIGPRSQKDFAATLLENEYMSNKAGMRDDLFGEWDVAPRFEDRIARVG